MRLFATMLLAIVAVLALSGGFNVIAFALPMIGNALWQTGYLLPAWVDPVTKLVQVGLCA